MNVSEINPYIRYASTGDFKPYPYFGYAADCRLFYVREGKCLLFIGEDSHQLEKGHLVIIFPGEKYRFTEFEGAKVAVINFDFDQSRARVRNTYRLSETPQKKLISFKDFSGFDRPIVLRNYQRAEQWILSIVEEYEKRRIFYREKASAHMKLLVCDVIRYISTTKDIANEKIEAILSYIAANLSGDLCAEELGSRFGYHPYYISRLIRLHTGKTLKQYVIDLRIAEAKRLLRTTDMTLIEITFSCGFENLAYFSNSFKRRTGISPAKYRKNGESLF